MIRFKFNLLTLMGRTIARRRQALIQEKMGAHGVFGQVVLKGYEREGHRRVQGAVPGRCTVEGSDVCSVTVLSCYGVSVLS